MDGDEDGAGAAVISGVKEWREAAAKCGSGLIRVAEVNCTASPTLGQCTQPPAKSRQGKKGNAAGGGGGGSGSSSLRRATIKVYGYGLADKEAKKVRGRGHVQFEEFDTHVEAKHFKEPDEDTWTQVLRTQQNAHESQSVAREALGEGGNLLAPGYWAAGPQVPEKQEASP